MSEFQTPRLGEAINLKTIVLRGILFLPGVKSAFEIARPQSIKTVRAAVSEKEKIFLVAQKDFTVEIPKEEDVCEIGVIASVESCKRLLNGNYQLVVNIEERGKRLSYSLEDDITTCSVTKAEDISLIPEAEEVALKKLWNFVDSYIEIISIKKADFLTEIREKSSLGEATDFFASHLIQSVKQKQELLDELNPILRSEIIMRFFITETVSRELEKEYFSKAVNSLKEAEREHFLREQLRQIRAELKDFSTDEQSDDENYFLKIENALIPSDIKEKLFAEASKLRKIPFGSMEANVISSHIDLCLELPWLKETKDRIDISEAKRILDRDHKGMEKVKERIIEYLSVKILKKELGGQILCLVGAPGVGKTSVAKSIAEAMGKKYSRVSLGGIRDEAEIRGHRKTYVGAMPGRIITAIKNSGVNNPLLLLDEIDKLTADSHGDPASALLEALDSEQNYSFRDHFVEYPFDLSKCFFIATANTLSTVPKPLLDRMEIINLESYTEIEKLGIALEHLVPKQRKRHGLKASNIVFKEEAIMKIIDSYTRESGVRNLEREIASVCRKCAKQIVEGKAKKITVTDKKVVELLGAEYFNKETIFEEDKVGCVNGLAWTSVGGEIMSLEALSMEGNGKIELTGSLGMVMKESAMAAVSYIRKYAEKYGVEPSFHSKLDIHIHAPEGAVPKDGPSAGIAMTTAILSELSGKKVKRDVAMTGEITLTGRVLPIGGLKEKTMAAYKAGVKTVILPEGNRKDIAELDDFIKDKLNFVYVSEYSQVAKVAFAE